MTLFECENCGLEHSTSEVISNNASCLNCTDTVTTYTLDAAEAIETLTKKVEGLREALGKIEKMSVLEWVDRQELELIIKQALAEKE